MTTIKKLPVLMYHNVTADQASAISITVAQLERHFCYIADNQYA